jgi:deazaflavin-dependent oxidoreductase (nitroreductase family)
VIAARAESYAGAVPSNRSLRIMNAMNRLGQRLSGGRFGWEFSGMPVVELTTTGRKSGQKRSTLLTSPLLIGNSYVVIASRGGDDIHPAWFLNLRDDPRVEVSIQGGARESRLARIADAEERGRLWPRVAADHPNYAGYQRRTEREIPLVLLDPIET